MQSMLKHHGRSILFATVVALSVAGPGKARADAITEWNTRTGEIIAGARIGTPQAIRAMAIIQTAAYETVNAISGKYPGSKGTTPTAKGASIDSAVAAAHRVTLLRLLPTQTTVVEAAFKSVVDAIPETSAKLAGLLAGERIAVATLSLHDDSRKTPNQYRPAAEPGAYALTVMPAGLDWPERRPWLMSSPAQFRPAPPPALGSEAWARNFNEVKSLGASNSQSRSPEQTEIARFWEYSLPPIYFGLLQNVVALPGREVTRNARLLMAVAQAMDDAMIGVMDAKYHYGFWRPITAIRNGDRDQNAATERDPVWTSFIDAPMHPEFPSAHSILAAAVATVIQAEIGDAAMPELSTRSPTANGARRSWSTPDDLVREVAEARIYQGVHYRVSTEVGVEMGRRIGELAAKRYIAP